MSRAYTAEDRERWRAQIQEAKRTMSTDEFADWLYRQLNSVGKDDPTLEDPMLTVVGVLALKADQPPTDVQDELSWRVGYQNALSDLIADRWPDAAGGRRISCAEMTAEDERRRP